MQGYISYPPYTYTHHAHGCTHMYVRRCTHKHTYIHTHTDIDNTHTHTHTHTPVLLTHQWFRCILALPPPVTAHSNVSTVQCTALTYAHKWLCLLLSILVPLHTMHSIPQCAMIKCYTIKDYNIK